jgi:hypothetical protein
MTMTLGEFFIEIKSKGVDKANADLKSAEQKAKETEKAISKLTDSFKTLGGAVISAMTMAAAAVSGFVVAGFAGTVQGERLAQQMRLLSLQVAAIFMPAFEKVVEVLSDATDWFKSLSGAQQESLMKWGLYAFAVVTVTKVLSTLGLLAPIVNGAMKALNATLVLMWANPVIAGIALLAIALGTVTGALLLGRNAARSYLDELEKIKAVGVGQAKSEALEVEESGKTKGLNANEKIKELQQHFENMEEIKKQGVEAYSYTGKNKDKYDVTQEMAITKMMIDQLRQNGVIDTNAIRKGMKERNDELAPKVGGFEGASAAYGRIVQSVINSFDPQKAADKQLDATKDANVILERIANNNNNAKPAPAVMAP